MKPYLYLLVAALLGGSFGVQPIFAADAAASSDKETAAKAEVRALIKKIEGKLQQGKDKEADFTAELKEFDDLAAKLKPAAPEAAAEAAFMKALLYLQVFEDNAKGAELMKGVKASYGDTKAGKQAGDLLVSLEKQSERDAHAKKMDAALAVGSKFPDFNEKDLNGKPLSLADYKGKVLLVDFWATWCGPCRAELPNVLETYSKYQSKGFDVLGISLDEDKDKLQEFIESKKMPWRQYFDGKGWETKLSQAYGIRGIPATFLLDGEGKIIAKNLRGEALGTAVAKALEKK